MALAGRTVVVAATEDRAAALARALEAHGAVAIPFPTVRLVPPPDPAALDAAVRRWRAFDWVVFTSARGVEAVAERARALEVDLAASPGKVAAVGPATKAAAESAGLHVHAIPEEFLTDAIAGVLGDVCGRSVLLPRSRIARKALAEELKARGARVTEVDAYDAVPASPDLGPLRAAKRVDFVLFTSGSAVDHFVSLVPPDLLEQIRSTADAAAIGPVTAEAARDRGFRVSVVAQEHTAAGLVHALTGVTVHG